MMVRVLLSVLGGYLAMALLAVVLFYFAFPVFAPQEEQATLQWMAISLALVAVASAFGGRVAWRISERSEGVYALGAIVVIMGFAATGATEPDNGSRLDLLSIALFSRDQGLFYPEWYEWARPIVAGVFVWYAGRPSQVRIGFGA